jgi:hypothetical protein
MPPVGFEPTIPTFERAKIVHELDRAAIVIGKSFIYSLLYLFRMELYSKRNCWELQLGFG